MLVDVWKRFSLMLVVLCLLQACATRPDVTQEDSINVPTQTLTHWTARGRLAVVTPDDKESAYFNWRNQADIFKLKFTTLIGSTIASVEQTPVQATLIADDQTLTGTTAEELISQVIGWHLPVNAVQSWIVAQPLSSDIVTRFDNGLIQTLTPQDYRLRDWRISYSKYETFTSNTDGQELPLPTRMKIENAVTQQSVIIRVDNWQMGIAPQS